MTVRQVPSTATLSPSVAQLARTITADKPTPAAKMKAISRGCSLALTGKAVAGSGRASPARFAKLVLGHWTVENNIHWLRDAVGFEDRCSSHDPNAACALALLRTALLAPLRAAGHLSLTKAMEDFARTPRLALAVLLHQRLASPNW